MKFSLVVFETLPSIQQAQAVALLGADLDQSQPFSQALERASGTAFGHLASKGVLLSPGLHEQLATVEPRILALAARQEATLIALDEETDFFCVMQWQDGQLLRHHSASGEDYVSEGEPLLVELAILDSFKPVTEDGPIWFQSVTGERFSAGQVGDALVHAVLEQVLADVTEVGNEPVQLYEGVLPVGGDPSGAESAQASSASGGSELLKMLVSKGQVELEPDADLGKLGLGVEPFLTQERKSYDAAVAMIDWLVEQPGIEEVYVAPEHLAKLIARW